MLKFCVVSVLLSFILALPLWSAWCCAEGVSVNDIWVGMFRGYNVILLYNGGCFSFVTDVFDYVRGSRSSLFLVLRGMGNHSFMIDSDLLELQDAVFFKGGK